MPADNDVPNDEPVTLDELTSVLRAHEGPPHARPRSTEVRSSAPRRRPRLRWTLAVAVVALLVGSGLGFGLGNSVTPSGNAGTPFAGFGFLPARGWTVVQSGTLDSSGAATAIAASAPLHPSDDLRGTPDATLESLPARGVLIHATFTTRGDPGEDYRFPARTSPLQVAGAEPVSRASNPLRSSGDLVQRRLRAAVGGFNVDTHIYFGAAPSAQMVAAAQVQLNKLVVAAERVTIFARPSAVRWGTPMTLFGTAQNAKEHEVVTIQARECGASSKFFVGVAAAETRAGGGWSIDYAPWINSTLRAVWKDQSSQQITVRQRPEVSLRQRSARGFEVAVRAKRQFWRRPVQLQRFDRRLGRWAVVRSVVLTEQTAAGRGYVVTSAEFRASLPKGTLIRTVLPLAQARPCYLAGTSNTWRT